MIFPFSPVNFISLFLFLREGHFLKVPENELSNYRKLQVMVYHWNKINSYDSKKGEDELRIQLKMNAMRNEYFL